MNFEFHNDQVVKWPEEGRHILAQFDNDNIIVYQAYRAEIGKYAIENQCFGGAFSFNRMSWIKPNFLWMMYRSGWGTKEGQEVTLAVTIPRALFEEILVKAIPSSFDSERFESLDSWKNALTPSEVRLQWDPDHGPDGTSLKRRAIQLGLRGSMLRRFGVDEVVKIEDISELVSQQRSFVQHDEHRLKTPAERVFLPSRNDARIAVGLDAPLKAETA